jgi:4-hydroxybenzoate polyprenyltransferase
LPAAAIGRDAFAHPGPSAVLLTRGILAASFALGFSYGVNALYDRDTDRDVHKNPLAGVRHVAVETRGIVCASGALAILAAAPGGLGSVTAVTASIVAGGIYSAGPRLKRYPIVGTALNVGIFLPLLWVAAAPISLSLPMIFVTLLLQNQLWHEREDLEEDSAGGVRTTAGVLGDRATRVATAAIGALGALGTAGVLAGDGRAIEVGASVAACALGTLAPMLAPPRRRREMHRAAAITAGALVYVAALAR